MRTVITGATGLIGQSLVKRFKRPVVLSRNANKAFSKLGNVEAYGWTPSQGPPPKEALEGADVVFSLAGEPVAGGRWTSAKKKRIYDSRVLGVNNLVSCLSKLTSKPRVLISASAIGIYGERGEEELDETAFYGNDFLARVCIDWEKEALAAVELGIRVVCIRFGIVLSRNGGALAQMLPVFRMGLGGKLGSGSQWMSWIHIDDAVNLLCHVVENESIEGALNATAPTPVTNADFTRSLARQINRLAIFPVPRFGLKLAFGEMSDVVMTSQKVLPNKARDLGFEFQHTQLESALSDLLKAS